MDNNTRKLLNLTDESPIFTEDGLFHEARNNCSVNMITGRLNSTNGISTQSGFSTFVKNGTYRTINQLSEVERQPTYLKLKRDRYICKNCSSNYSYSTYLVGDYGQVSKRLKYLITFDLTSNRSRKEITLLHNVPENNV